MIHVPMRVTPGATEGDGVAGEALEPGVERRLAAAKVDGEPGRAPDELRFLELVPQLGELGFRGGLQEAGIGCHRLEAVPSSQADRLRQGRVHPDVAADEVHRELAGEDLAPGVSPGHGESQ